MHQFEANKIKLNIEIVDLKDVINQCLKMFDATFRKKGVALIFNIENNDNSTIRSDKNRIKQIIMNLISNALKFTSKGYVKIVIKNLENEDKVSISVRDTGIGIAQQDLAKLFKAFGKLEDKAKLNPTGMGIGLEFSQKLSKLLGGKIYVNSKEGVGTKFDVRLAKDASNINSQNIIKENISIASSMKELSSKMSKSIISISSEEIMQINQIQEIKEEFQSETNRNLNFVSNSIPTFNCQAISTPIEKMKLIISVDDEVNNHSVIEAYSSKLKLRVEKAYNGKEAINLCMNMIEKHETISLLMTDFNMPIMGGEEMAEKLKTLMAENKISQFPIIGLSGDNITSKFMDDVILKPIYFHEFSQLLRKYKIID